MHSTQYSEVQYNSYIFWSIAICVVSRASTNCHCIFNKI